MVKDALTESYNDILLVVKNSRSLGTYFSMKAGLTFDSSLMALLLPLSTFNLAQ